MGLLDFIEKTIEKTTEGVISIPATPFKIGKGVVDGIDKGIENIEETIDDLFE